MSGIISHSGLTLPDLASHRGLSNLATIDGLAVAAGWLVDLPLPTVYYAFEDQSTDEMGVADLSAGDTYQIVTGKKLNCAYRNTPGTRHRASGYPLALLDNIIATCWVKRPAAGSGSVLLGSFYSGSSSYTFYVHLSYAMPADTDWHHICAYCLSGTQWRVITDGGTPQNASGAVDVSTLICPMVSLDGYIDEYGWLNTGSTVTDEIAAQYAATLYNGGAGRFYRATTGWR